MLLRILFNSSGGDAETDTNSNVVGSISTADGSALVRLGNTTIVCGVKAEIAEPELDSPEVGFLGEYNALHFSYTPYLITVHSI